MAGDSVWRMASAQRGAGGGNAIGRNREPQRTTENLKRSQKPHNHIDHNKGQEGETMNDTQKRVTRQIEELLWDHLKRDPEHRDRRQTGWGTKTLRGLVACIEHIISEG